MSDSKTIAGQYSAFLAHIGAQTVHPAYVEDSLSAPLLPPNDPLILTRSYTYVPPARVAGPIELAHHVNPIAREAALAGVRRPRRDKTKESQRETSACFGSSKERKNSFIKNKTTYCIISRR